VRRKFTIYRRSWSRGENSVLYDGQGRGCCLGHFAQDILGLSRDRLYDRADMEDVFGLGQGIEGVALFRRIDTEAKAIALNDSVGLTEEEREEKLKALFAAEDIEVEFVEGRRKW